MSLEALVATPELNGADASRLKEILDELVAAGSLVETSNGSYGCPVRMNLVVGTLRAHADGFAFITPARGSEQADLFVPGRHSNGAMNGDRVVGRIEHKRRSGKVEGRVIRVLERARTQLVGTFKEGGAFPFVKPLDPKLGTEIMIAGDVKGATPGQLVAVEITEYASGSRPPAGAIREVLGDTTDDNIDIEVVIREYGLRHEFPADVLAEAAKVPTEVTEAEIEGRTDFRSMPIITIDGESAQDFDDAVHVELRPNGLYRLHVHIADVGHYVKPGSAIDREAIERATSVYFVDRVLPMLPEQLSNEICSLKPKVDRLVQTVLIDIDRDGRTVNYEFHDGVINSADRMTYSEVAGILAEDEKLREKYPERVRDLERMAELATILTEHRRERGSIDFDLPVPELVLNLRGETEDIVRSERNAAHRLIEEFMIRANEVVASHLVWEDIPAMFRVHEGPDPERIETLRDFLTGLGHTLGGGRRPQPRDFMELLGRLVGRPEERVVSMLLLRSMKRAQYQVDNEGHFGLASYRYTHFTSPIRRYPDLVVHRALRADRLANEVEGGTPGAPEAPAVDLAALAAACSTTERIAEQAERTYADWKKLQFMADKVGETYEGHLVTVKSFGCFVELEPFFVEGLIAVSSLTDDYYRFDEAKHELRGERTGRVLKLGDRVKITVAKVDMNRRHLDFALLEGPLEVDAPPPVQRRRRRRSRGGRRGGAGRAGQKKTEQPTAEGTEGKAVEPRAASTTSDENAEPRRRRRRGRRGGRRRGQKTQEQQSGTASTTESKPSQGDGQGGGRGAQQQRGEAKPERSGRSDQPDRKATSGNESGGGGKSRGGGRGGSGGGRGRGDRSRGRGKRPQRSRNDGAMPAAAPAKPVTPATKPAGDAADKSKPAVNPYLTDIDF
jgi:ribonuclease R